MSLDPRLVDAIRREDGLARFFRVSVVQDERDGALRTLTPASTQRPVLAALRRSNRVVVNKPRQAYASTACVLEALRRTEYWPGHNGLILANKADTSDILFDRVLTAYKHQHETIKVPSATRGRRGISFLHGGNLRVITAGGDDPGYGSSLDFLHVSEFGSFDHGIDVLTKVMPALAKRTHASVVIESTPGPHGGDYHGFWVDSLAGKTGYLPVFIAWWQHRSYELDGSDLLPTPEEEELLRTWEGMTRGHLAFRRKALAEFCDGDERLFSARYPYDESSGWYSGGVPALPSDDLTLLLSDAGPDVVDPQHPKPGTEYLVACDPAGYGAQGDPSAWTMWDRNEGVEVGSWSGRIEPTALASRLSVLGKRFNDALVVVESNAAACITGLLNIGYRNVYSTSASHPGWYRTAQARDRAHGRLVQLLKAGRFGVRSKAGVMQLLAYDGTKPRGQGHHWDRVDTYLMAADLMAANPRQPLHPQTPEDRAMTVRRYKALHAEPKRPGL